MARVRRSGSGRRLTSAALGFAICAASLRPRTCASVARKRTACFTRSPTPARPPSVRLWCPRHTTGRCSRHPTCAGWATLQPTWGSRLRSPSTPVGARGPAAWCAAMARRARGAASRRARSCASPRRSASLSRSGSSATSPMCAAARAPTRAPPLPHPPTHPAPPRL